MSIPLKGVAEYLTIARRRYAAPDVRRLDRRLFPVDEPRQAGEDWWWEIRDAYGELVAYAAATVRGRTCILTRCGVSRRGRGRGLQRRLVAAREAWAKTQGCRFVATYVLWENHASINSLVGVGYRVCAPAKYRWQHHTGFLVLHKKLGGDA